MVCKHDKYLLSSSHPQQNLATFENKSFSAHFCSYSGESRLLICFFGCLQTVFSISNLDFAFLACLFLRLLGELLWIIPSIFFNPHFAFLAVLGPQEAFSSSFLGGFLCLIAGE